jgi:hypothetical protein
MKSNASHSTSHSIFISLPSVDFRSIPDGQGSTQKIRSWVTFDLLRITCIVPNDVGTVVVLNDGTNFTLTTRDNELKYIMATKAGMSFVGYDWETEQDTARNFRPEAMQQQLPMQSEKVETPTTRSTSNKLGKRSLSSAG